MQTGVTKDGGRLVRSAGAGLAVLTLAACGGYERPKAVADAAAMVPDKVDYNWDVRPILSQNCFACHGNDAAKRKAGLRLDVAADAYGPLPENKKRHAIVRGNPGKSELLRRILTTDPDARMPPMDSHKVMTPVQIATLEKWIKQGAKYKEHWAYIPAKVVRPKGSPFDKQAVNTVDRYVFAKLDKHGLKPSPQADRETLINRVTLDLTGLPPSLQEVDAFVADKRPDAYERLVDRLLASPAYGERMANDWMDVARYSETDGYLDDRHGRFFAPWREWVIGAFNRNMPYDRFATWQLAGDLMPNRTREQVLATAFGRLGRKSTENGVIDEEMRVEYRNERAELVGKAFLGLTVGCARCHDHKYDVISQKEYYALTGFFNSIDERGQFATAATGRITGPTLNWPTAQQQAEQSRLLAAVNVRKAAYEAARRTAAINLAPRIDAVLAKPGAAGGQVAQALQGATEAYFPFDTAYKGSVEMFKRPRFRQPPPPSTDPAFLPEEASAPRPPPAPAAAPKPAETLLPNAVVEADLQLTPSGLPGGLPAAVERAKFVPGVKGKAFYIDNDRAMLPPKIGWHERGEDFAFDFWMKPRTGKAYKDAVVINHQDHTFYVGDGGYTVRMEGDRLRFEFVHNSPFNMISVVGKRPVPAGRWTHVTVSYDGSSKASGVKAYLDGQPVELEVRHDNLTRTMLPTGVRGTGDGDFFNFSLGTKWRAEEFTGGAIDEVRIFNRALTPVEASWLHNPAKTTINRERMLELAVATDPQVVAAKTAFAAAVAAQTQAMAPIKQIMVMGDSPQVRPTYLLNVGLYDQPRDEVKPRGFDRVFKWKAKTPENRLGLTEWLFDKKNPLTARVFVNRLWASHFGAGIVPTVEDFGTQGANPTNPELLDWLAVEFVRSGWDIKHMHRLMVTSSTYRQSSTVTKDRLEQDPQNVYLSRGPRYRLSAEQIRDNALAASGLLVNKIGGGSTYPYQPAGVWEDSNSVYLYPDAPLAPNDQNHRRSMYTFMKRNAQAPSMVLFDQADRNVSTVSRRTSNTPLQALVLLNDPQFLEAYRALAERSRRMGGDEEQQIVTMFRLAVRRSPRPTELKALTTYYAAEKARFAREPEKAQKLLRIGVKAPDPTDDPAATAAMSMVAAGIMNTPDAYSIR